VHAFQIRGENWRRDDMSECSAIAASSIERFKRKARVGRASVWQRTLVADLIVRVVAH
jgi:hypothetical protein